jgi:F-box protein 21
VQVQETSENLKRWRFVLSPESKASYPEDDAIASAWVKEGILP